MKISGLASNADFVIYLGLWFMVFSFSIQASCCTLINIVYSIGYWMHIEFFFYVELDVRHRDAWNQWRNFEKKNTGGTKIFFI